MTYNELYQLVGELPFLLSPEGHGHYYQFSKNSAVLELFAFQSSECCNPIQSYFYNKEVNDNYGFCSVLVDYFEPSLTLTPTTCICDFHSVIRVSGCKCGGK